MTRHEMAQYAYAADMYTRDQVDGLAWDLGRGDDFRVRVARELILCGEAFVHGPELFDPREVTVIGEPGAAKYRIRYRGEVYDQHEVLYLARRVRAYDLRGTSPLSWLFTPLPLDGRGSLAWMRKRALAKICAELARLEAE